MLEQWKFIQGFLNPADHTSCGIKAYEKGKWEEYLGGPRFLHQDEKDWPKMEPRYCQPGEVVVMKAVTVWTWTEEEEAQLSFYKIAMV